MAKKQAKSTSAKSHYMPTPKEHAAVQKVFARSEAASPAPRFKVRDNEISLDHPNRLVGKLLMMGALGTSDSDFQNGLVEQLANVHPAGAEESGLNFSISVVKGVEPRDQVEAMLAAQMAVIHMTAMRFARRVALADNLLELESAERGLNKLVRSFTTLTEALKRYRAVGEQSVKVQNVSVQHGGQAIVGNVTQHSPASAPDQTAISPPAIPDARAAAPMEILGELEHEPVPARRKSNA
jgi:hypothetical protein